MEMTVTRALAELKLLNDRITRKTNQSFFITANKKSAKKVNNVTTKEEFVEQVKSNYNSVLDLIERRKKIKSAIVDSNSKTTVKIGEKTMTVAEAIERKESIIFEKNLLNTLQNQYNSAIVSVNRQNEKVQEKLDELLLQSFGKEGRQMATEDEIGIISKPYLEQNEYEVINPLSLQNIIEGMQKDIEDFTMEVDFVLSESNTITKIVVD